MVNFSRINKAAARKRFEAGNTVYFIAHKMRPGYPFSLGMNIYRDLESKPFDDVVKNFTFWNCSHETGYYPAYYIELDN